MSVVSLLQGINPVTTGVGVIGAVASSWFFARFLRPRYDRLAASKVDAAHDRADSKKPAATVTLTHRPIPWTGWLSDEVIDLPLGSDPGELFNRFPGHERAINASEPFRTDGAELVISRLSFDLTGTHRTATKIASIKAVIDYRGPVPRGTVYFAVPQGTTDKEEMAFDLGSLDLNARVQDGDGAPTSELYRFWRTTTLVRGESIGFIAVVFAPLYGEDIRYHLEIAFDAGPPVTVYDDDGSSFRIVGYPRTADRAYFAASQQHKYWPGYPRSLFD